MYRKLVLRRGGFTLVDVLFGIVITAIGLMALSYLLALPTMLNRDSHYNMLAYRAARQQIELIRQQYRNSLPPTVTDAAFTNSGIAALPNGSGRMHTKFSRGLGVIDKRNHEIICTVKLSYWGGVCACMV
jgi:type II secretory pathway pseudopilin PulG